MSINHPFSRRAWLKHASALSAATLLPGTMLSNSARADTSQSTRSQARGNDAPAQTPESLTVMLDWYANPSHGPLIIAKQKGLFDAHGIDLTIQAPTDPSAPPKLVAAGKIDLALSYQPQLHLHAASGLPLTRIGTLIDTPLNVLVVRKDSGIESLSDLKGKRIGYSVGGVERVLLDGMLRDSGLSEADVDLVNVNFSLTPALISGKVDAVTGAFRNFELAQMRQEGVEGRPFFIEEHGIPAYEELIFIAERHQMASRKEAYARFMAALEQAALWIVNHPQEGWETFKQYDPVLDNPVNQSAWFDSIVRFALRPAALDTGRYRRFDRFLHESGAIDQPNDIHSLAIDINA